uniref:histidine kinase n=1 Tax=Tanacetum cinerariifolium TaxID=118510 RepID=A0A699GMD2_TANCI|nr:sensory transduction histidine kinase, putative [Tanacetum cinerariifolium]
MAHGVHRHHDGVLHGAQFEAHVDELAREQRELGVRKARLGLDGAGLGVDLVVQRRELAAVEGIGTGAVQRQRRQRRVLVNALHQVRHAVLRDREFHVDGRHLRDHGDAGGVARPHQVADIDHAQAHPARDRRDHLGVAQIEPGRAFGRAVGHDRAFELLDQRGLGVDVLAGDRVLFQQGAVALQREFGVFQLRLVALALAAGLQQRHFELARIDLRHHLAGLDHLAFLEQHILQNARDLRAHGGGGRRRHRAQCFERDGNVGLFGRGHTHRGGGHAAPTATAARTARTGPAHAARAGRAGHGSCRLVGEIPGQPAQSRHGGHRDHAADDLRTAAAGAGMEVRIGLDWCGLSRHARPQRPRRRGADRGRPGRRRDPRPDAARYGWPGRVPPGARRVRRAGAHAHRARRRHRPHRGPGNGRRRLPAQAVRTARAAGPRARHPAPPGGPAPPRQRTPRGAGRRLPALRPPGNRSGLALRAARRRAVRTDGVPVRPAAGDGAPRRPRAVARQPDGTAQGRTDRSVRPFDRRPHVAHPRRPRAARPAPPVLQLLCRAAGGAAAVRDGGAAVVGPQRRPARTLQRHAVAGDDERAGARRRAARRTAGRPGKGGGRPACPHDAVHARLAPAGRGGRPDTGAPLAPARHHRPAARIVRAPARRPAAAVERTAGLYPPQGGAAKHHAAAGPGDRRGGVSAGAAPDQAPGTAAAGRGIAGRRQPIEQLVGAHKTLLANASHELRTPLARIRLALELVKDNVDPKRRAGLEQDIAELNDLLDEILLASRLGALTDTTQYEEIDLLALAAEECARYDDVVLDGVSAVMQGDARLLRRLLRNLLENAYRHGVPPVHVTIEAMPAQGQARLVVWDEGPGIPAAEFERVFEPFYRRRNTCDNSGAGLGLALIRQIARRHGGEARCVARGNGSGFEITLPATAAPAAQPGAVRNRRKRLARRLDVGQPPEVVRYAAREPLHHTGRHAGGRRHAPVHLRRHGLRHDLRRRTANHVQHALELAHLALDVHHAVLGQLGAFGGRRQRVAVAAQRVDQAPVLGLGAGPYAALRHGVDFFGRGLAGPGRARGELRVDVIDAALHHLHEARVQRPQGIVGVAQPRGGLAGRVDAQLVHHFFGSGQNGEHADRAGDRVRFGDHFVGRHRNPVAARCRHIAHRDYHRLAGRAREFQLAADQFRRKGAAARRIDAQHHRLDVLVLARGAYQLGRGVAADAARTGRAVADLALGDDHANGVASQRIGMARQVFLEAHLAEAFFLVVGRAALDHQVADFIAGFQAVHQLRCQRQFGDIAIELRHLGRQRVDMLHDLA